MWCGRRSNATSGEFRSPRRPKTKRWRKGREGSELSDKNDPVCDLLLQSWWEAQKRWDKGRGSPNVRTLVKSIASTMSNYTHSTAWLHIMVCMSLYFLNEWYLEPTWIFVFVSVWKAACGFLHVVGLEYCAMPITSSLLALPFPLFFLFFLILWKCLEDQLLLSNFKSRW